MRERSTPQLAAVYEALLEASDHPTAEQLHERVRRRIPRLSVGTVYRNLEKLQRQGRVRALHVGDGAARFDAVVSDHDHFVCDRCGSVEDVEPALPATAPDELERRGYRVRSRHLVAYGLCRECVASS